MAPTWRPIGALPRALSGATACEFGGAVYLLGGSSGARADEDPDIALAVFEPAPVSADAPADAGGAWREHVDVGGDVPCAREGHSATVIHSSI